MTGGLREAMRDPRVAGALAGVAILLGGYRFYAAVRAKREPEGGLLADLRGTVITGNHGIAIFGDRLVPAGGKVGEWTVEKVAPYGVSLRRGGETRTVEMFKPSP